MIENFQVDTKENCVTISVNSRIYSMEMVQSAAYTMMDKCYILIDQNNREIIAEIRLKNGGADLEKIAREFNNELINFYVYISESFRSKEEKIIMMKRALITNSQKSFPAESAEEMIGNPPVEDPEGIAKPWTESCKPK